MGLKERTDANWMNLSDAKLQFVLFLPAVCMLLRETNKKNGVPATRLEVWMAGYTKDNKPSNDKVVEVMSDADKLNRRLVRLKSTNRTRERLRRDGFLGLFGHKVDLLDYHEKKLQDLEVNKPY
ncbi:hypothetical protein HYC85_007313 [Camellia sinensis]|uniref:Uncharacterized protein n=1 Tax=Camellia sinensis TaxID=4442 RepID=A0A7J7HPU7_CAMSI|nr:hypothetical protein HYC85_007313 [Camellia sinensis]